MAKKKTTPEFDLFASVATYLKDDLIVQNKEWIGSPFAWIRELPSGAKGKLGKQLISSWCAAKGLATASPKDSDADLLINNHRIEIKFSTLWKTGIYRFQQIRDQNYEHLVALGISPFEVHCWVISKSVLKKNVIGHSPQHTGASGSDTFWIGFKPHNPPEWLSGCGGDLDGAHKILKSLK